MCREPVVDYGDAGWLQACALHAVLYCTSVRTVPPSAYKIGSFDIQGGVSVDGARDWLYIHAVMLCLIYRMTRVDFIY